MAKVLVAGYQVTPIVEKQPEGCYFGWLKEYPSCIAQEETQEECHATLLSLFETLATEFPEDVASGFSK